MAKHYKQKDKKDVLLSILRILFFITLVTSIFYMAKWYIDGRENKILGEKVSEAITIEKIENEDNTNSEIKIDFEKLKQINKDTVAWLKVNGTNIENVVVKSDDNNYYLNHNFEKKFNKAGWIFADYKNKFDGTDKNIVIYGHNRKDNSMFGTLKNILQEEWYNNEESHTVSLITEKEEQQYEVFSIYQIKNEDYYIKTEFKDNEFQGFVDILKNRSIKDFEVEVSEEDSLLTLSTCGSNKHYRIVLHAKKCVYYK